MSNRRHRLHPRLSPLIIRFAEPEINATGAKGTIMRKYICTFTMDDDEGNTTAYHLHATKGWRKRRVWG